MIQGMTLIEMAQELEHRSHAKRDFLADTRELDFQVAEGGNTTLMIGHDRERTFRITDHTHHQIAQRVGIPARYYQRMRTDAPPLLEQNVRHWFTHRPERRMVRTLDGNARAFLSDRYRRVDNEQIAEAALPVLLESDEIQILSATVTELKMYLQAVFPRLEGEVRPGDPVQGGLIITNSEIGNGAFEIRPMVYRLVCTNGMITGEEARSGRLRRRHIGRQVEGDEDYTIYEDDTREADDRALMLKIRDAIRALSDPQLFLNLMTRMSQAAASQPVANPVAAVEELGKSFALPEGERHSILEQLIRSGDYSQWGMTNAVTAISNSRDSYDRAVELEEIGGRVLELDARAWKRLAEAA